MADAAAGWCGRRSGAIRRTRRPIWPWCELGEVADQRQAQRRHLADEVALVRNGNIGEMYLKRIFRVKFGDPLAFIFKGQVWDSHLASGATAHRQCGICARRHTRYIFVLKKVQTRSFYAAPEVGKLEIGTCCFHYFRKWNPDLYYALQFAYENELTRSKAIARDKRVFGNRTKVTVHMAEWKRVRRQANIRLQQMEQQNAMAPIADLLALRAILEKQPRLYKRPINAVRWYDRQITQVEERLHKLQ